MCPTCGSRFRVFVPGIRYCCLCGTLIVHGETEERIIPALALRAAALLEELDRNDLSGRCALEILYPIRHATKGIRLPEPTPEGAPKPNGDRRNTGSGACQCIVRRLLRSPDGSDSG
jgi:hypothetical protein